MQTHDKISKNIKRLYVHLQLLLNLEGFLKSKEFELFCEENGLEKFRDAVVTSLQQDLGVLLVLKRSLTTSGNMIIDFDNFPEALVKPFLKDFLIEIYEKRNEQFVEIVVSFLSYYSQYNRDFREGKPTPIDDNLMRKIALDLINLREGDDDVRMFFELAGYDLDALLPSLNPEPTELQDEPALKTEENIISDSAVKERSNNRKIFIVHGQDEKIKYEVEEFLISIELEPIILHKQADLGKTIIEKVEYYSDVSFAVILLTKEDVGTKHIQYVPVAKNPTNKAVLAANIRTNRTTLQNLRWRARQNVIFEFGYFIAKLGRDRVAALCEDRIERPSDIDGLLYTPLDQGGKWKKKLAKEINAAGIPINSKFP